MLPLNQSYESAVRGYPHQTEDCPGRGSLARTPIEAEIIQLYSNKSIVDIKINYIYNSTI